MDAGIVIAVILAFIIGLFLMRALGAWMLRIDEVIKHQKETVELLKRIETHFTDKSDAGKSTTTTKPDTPPSPQVPDFP